MSAREPAGYVYILLFMYIWRESRGGGVGIRSALIGRIFLALSRRPSVRPFAARASTDRIIIRCFLAFEIISRDKSLLSGYLSIVFFLSPLYIIGGAPHPFPCFILVRIKTRLRVRGAKRSRGRRLIAFSAERERERDPFFR